MVELHVHVHVGDFCRRVAFSVGGRDGVLSCVPPTPVGGRDGVLSCVPPTPVGGRDGVLSCVPPTPVGGEMECCQMGDFVSPYFQGHWDVTPLG